MRILVTNDDGIHAQGLKVMEEIAHAIGDEVWVIAPETDQSGVAHSLSLNDPIRLREVAPNHYAVKGTPTDCVIMGVRFLMRDHKPDLVLSGVNRGQNLAEDVTYSGTIAGAMEGTILGIPSIALSQAYGPLGRSQIHWDCARHHAPETIRKVIKEGISSNVLININFPDCAPEDVKATSVTAQGQRDQEEFLGIREQQDGRGNPYYWIGFPRGENTPDQGTDLWAIANHCISVTPLRLDLTDYSSIAKYGALFS